MELTGKVILNTRTREQASELTELIESRGGQALLFPCLEISPPENWSEVEKAILAVGTESWVLFTSANGVRKIFEFADEGVLPEFRSRLGEASLAVIGAKTALALKDYDLTAHFVAEESNSESFADEFVAFLRDSGIEPSEVLLLRGKIASESLPDRLRASGLRVSEFSVYNSSLPTLREAELSSLKTGKPDFLTFTSSQAVKNFAEILNSQLQLSESEQRALQTIPVATVGPKTSKTANSLGFQTVLTAKQTSLESMLSLIVGYPEPLQK